MSTVRFVMIGGFLGAGKTTTIARLARHYTEQGQRVGIVTNDQAYNLVDTRSLQAQGFDVGEVPGACFCCKFDDLVETARKLSAQQRPDVIIAEPVGSCTDLVATVIEPLRHLYQDDFEVGSLAVLLKPEHGRKILGGGKNLGFSAKAAYIFLKQIEEADVVVLNKIDKLAADQRDDLLKLVSDRFPNHQVMAMSAQEGTGFEELVQLLEQPASRRAGMMEVDYDTYAEGEAELGWLNCQVNVTAEQPFELDSLVTALVAKLGKQLQAIHDEPAHVKVLGQVGPDAAVANLVAGDEQAELSLASEIRAQAAELVINARVAGAPDELEEVVETVVRELASEHHLQATVEGMQRFRPGRPVPTHRYR